MIILGIETSCDETAVAVLECEGELDPPSFEVRAHELYSQAKEHEKYGGVYPSLAKRLHSRNLIPLLREALEKSGFGKSKVKSQKSKIQVKNQKEVEKILEREPELLEQFKQYVFSIDTPDIDAIAVTVGPGLEPALWVGINFAKALSIVWDTPLVPVNHMEAHIFSVLGRENMGSTKFQAPNSKRGLEFPLVALLVSGGHTELVYSPEWFVYEKLGATRDDAVGEAFDKVARMLELPYPGGPHISRLAEQARNESKKNKAKRINITLPRPMIDSDNLDFSFSGLKTAVLYHLKEKGELREEEKAELAREFEDAVVDVLVKKTKRALQEYSPKTFILAGGVAANKELRRRLAELLEHYPETTLLIAPQELTGDNAVMICIAGYLRLQKESPARLENISARGNLSL